VESDSVTVTPLCSASTMTSSSEPAGGEKLAVDTEPAP
jgi:hypothetical protein